jgi:signal transduction histidine kinase
VSNPMPPGGNGRRAVGGHGVLGMRERAALLGGIVRVGSHGRCFRVDARLPYLPSAQR